jgi:hypothetical protein
VVWKKKPEESIEMFADRLTAKDGPWVRLEISVPPEFAEANRWPVEAVHHDHIAWLHFTRFSFYQDQPACMQTYMMNAAPQWLASLIDQMHAEKYCDERFRTAMMKAIDEQMKAKTLKVDVQ